MKTPEQIIALAKERGAVLRGNTYFVFTPEELRAFAAAMTAAPQAAKEVCEAGCTERCDAIKDGAGSECPASATFQLAVESKHRDKVRAAQPVQPAPVAPHVVQTEEVEQMLNDLRNEDGNYNSYSMRKAVEKYEANKLKAKS